MNKLYGLIGKKLGHSFSPQIHKIIFEKANLNGYYDLYETEEQNLEITLKNLWNKGIKGLNVTIPYKVEVMKYLDIITAEAKSIGAVNTIELKEAYIKGHNTDYSGFGATLIRNRIDLSNKTALILGTGGVSKSVYQYLINNGIKDVTFASRNINNYVDKSNELKIISYEEAENNVNGDLIINCTPCGMYPNNMDCPVNKALIMKYETAIDLIYNPRKTVFLSYAMEAGRKAINGLYKLVAQAVCAEEIWNDIIIAEEIVQEIYEEIDNMMG
jgi:shikimate dehydrogenase